MNDQNNSGTLVDWSTDSDELLPFYDGFEVLTRRMAEFGHLTRTLEAYRAILGCLASSQDTISETIHLRISDALSKAEALLTWVVSNHVDLQGASDVILKITTMQLPGLLSTYCDYPYQRNETELFATLDAMMTRLKKADEKMMNYNPVEDTPE